MTNQELNTHQIKVIGHCNPDTDSICSAIAYSRLKNMIDPDHPCKPCRAGLLNRETEFVLNYFNVPAPQLYTDVRSQIRDVDIRRMAGVDGEMSLRSAWVTMRDQEIDTLCVVDEEQNLKGVITVKDVATANMDVLDTYILAEAKTSYQNIIDTLGATVVVGDVEGKRVEGSIIIGSGSPEQMEKAISKGDIVIVGNRIESQLTALEMDAGCLVVCMDSKISRTICMLAEEKGCIILSTTCNTYVAGQMIRQAAPIRHYMVQKNLLYFNLNTSVEAATKRMASVRFRYFPILDDEGKYVGVVSRRNMMNLRKKQIILVDHNEKSQAVDGIDQAEVLEIIDHHRIGSMETEGPVYFRNVPVGCTCTIIYQMYLENAAEIDPTTAGLMLSAILSDTLMFRSPTCTPMDERAARALAEIAGVDLEKYADAMFEAGGDITGKTADEAEALLTAANLKGQAHEESNEAEAGTVFKQGKNTGEVVEEGTVIEYWVSTGPDTIDVPNLTGKTKEQAIEALGDKLSYTFSSDYSATVPAGSVISYEPGGSVKPGTTIKIVLSQGPEPVAKVNAPNFVNDSASHAKPQLESLGFKVVVNGPADGIIVSQSASGSLDKGTTITLTTQARTDANTED